MSVVVTTTLAVMVSAVVAEAERAATAAAIGVSTDVGVRLKQPNVS